MQWSINSSQWKNSTRELKTHENLRTSFENYENHWNPMILLEDHVNKKTLQLFKRIIKLMKII